MTGPEVWVPAFKWLKVLNAESPVLSSAEIGYCNLCESRFTEGREQHVRRHRQERKQEERRLARERSKANAERLRTINRERALESKVLA